MKDTIKNFLQNHDFCVLSSTNSLGQPESAFVGFSSNDQLEITIGLGKESRKYKNIIKRPNVSIVIGGEDGKTVQYEGLARELQDNKENYLQNHFEKLPGARKYITNEGQTWLVIEPIWVRYTDTTKSPQQVEEARLK